MKPRFPSVFFCSVLLLLAVLPVSPSFGEGEVVGQELQGESLYPGDLLELKLALRSPSYSRWSLSAPRHPNLRLLAAQELPVQMSRESGYETHWVVVYQAIQPGDGELAAGYLQRESGEAEERLLLESQTVSVSQFESLVDHDGLESIAAKTMREEVKGGWLLWSIAVFGVLVLGILLKKRLYQSRRGESEAVLGARDRLRSEVSAALSNGTIGRSQAQHLVDEYESVLSAASLEVLKRVAYSKEGDTAAAIELLRREAAL